MFVIGGLAEGPASSAGSTRPRRRARRSGADAGASEAFDSRTRNQCDRAKAWRRWRCRTRPSNRRASTPTSPDICRVVAIMTHPPAGDKVRIWIAIPSAELERTISRHRRRRLFRRLAERRQQPAALGFAAGATDTGHIGGSASFALDASGKLDWQAIRNFAHVGIHEMTVTGKALTEEMYGVAPRYSYFNGCSTGGRQGLMEAQRYPQDYNGIASAAPAINWTNLLMQSFWGSMLMNAASNPIPSCKLAAATAAAVAACDGIDGVKDGVLEDPRRCTFDPKSLIGTSAGDCGGVHSGGRRHHPQAVGRPAALERRPAVARTAARSRPELVSREPGDAARSRRRLGSLSTGCGTSSRRIRSSTGRPSRRRRIRRSGIAPTSSTASSSAPTMPDLSAFRDRGGKTIIWHGLRRSADHRRGHDRLLHARAAADGRRETDIGLRALVSRPRSRSLRRRSRSPAHGRARRTGGVGRGAARRRRR